jgi:PAS domain S-box-containing protein
MCELPPRAGGNQNAGALEKRLRSMFEHSLNPVFVCSNDGGLEFANPAFCQLQECSGEGQCDKSCGNLLTDRLTTEQRSSMWREVNAGRSWVAEVRWHDVGDKLVWQELRVAPLTDERNQPAGLLGSLEDITRRKSTESALEETQSQLRQLMLAAYDAMIIIDEDSGIQLWNQAATRIFGYSAEEAAGKDLMELIIPERNRTEQKRIRGQILQSGRHDLIERSKEAPALHKNGSEILVELSFSLVRLNGRLHILVVGRDISERKKREAERELLLTSLEEALANIKTLRGLVPICSACKRIRDDKGFWSQVESYVSAHSEAKFSHGICPECARKLYPDFAPALEAKFAKKPAPGALNG